MELLKMWLLQRLREPTTWGGLVTLLTGFGIYVSPEQMQAIIALGVAVGSALMVFLPEAPAAKVEKPAEPTEPEL